MTATLEQDKLAIFLDDVGLGGILSVRPIRGGANNRGYELETSQGRFFLKQYFMAPDETRSLRLDREFGFSEFCAAAGLNVSPAPIARHDGHGWGVYEFIEGTRFAGTATESEWSCALRFLEDLQRHRAIPLTQVLLNGAEACFSVDAHLDCIADRVRRLIAIRGREPIDAEARAFVTTQLAPAWQRVREAILRATPNPTQVLAPEDRVISPSDFGFHNALRRSDGHIVFVDFEYAGWDDPAKTIGDFLCQPAVPVPAHIAERFIEGACAILENSAWHRHRADLLLPAYRVKWCTILLNEFLADQARRRQFALSPAAWLKRRERQLTKAREFFLSTVAAEFGDFVS